MTNNFDINNTFDPDKENQLELGAREG